MMAVQGLVQWLWRAVKCDGGGGGQVIRHSSLPTHTMYRTEYSSWKLKITTASFLGQKKKKRRSAHEEYVDLASVRA